jgi:hypothetical protein
MVAKHTKWTQENVKKFSMCTPGAGTFSIWPVTYLLLKTITITTTRASPQMSCHARICTNVDISLVFSTIKG